MDSNSLFDVKGKVVLVTGGAKGIGRMIVEGFVASGAKVYISGREAKACHDAVSELSSLSSTSGGSAVALPADLQKLEDCQSLVAEITKREPGGLHVLVNNAGANWGQEIDTYPEAAWQKVLTLNLHRVFTLTQLCIPLLEKAAKPEDPARVVHIGSIDGIRVPSLSTFAYSASKAGLHHLSRALATELGQRDITSNVLACGPFPSKMMKATLEKIGDGIKASVPLRRVGSPEDVAGACIFLASRAGSYCNGALIRLDGGASLVSKF
ncbi:Rhamnolipids biosynthesis 3-oxoacyl-[acyl-carrier-protein] reductase [Cladobotryum mycophilum]|uniref:Rhamnolipids biosynthesis 3-oxoacyl-[acyl-carrier-protein] reductase n=1 Tax=Cladobotryum mycophilum TaxID=491253 RepID=A0ABR0SKX3_9HYPO